MEFEKYTNSEYNISLYYPADWEVIAENDRADLNWVVPARFRGPEGDSGTTIVTLQVSSNVMRIDEQPDELGPYMDRAIEQLAPLFQGFTVISKEQRKLAGWPSAWMHYSYTGDRGRIQELNVTILIGRSHGAFVQFICEIPGDLFKAVKPAVEACVNSVQFIGPGLRMPAVRLTGVSECAGCGKPSQTCETIVDARNGEVMALCSGCAAGPATAGSVESTAESALDDVGPDAVPTPPGAPVPSGKVAAAVIAAVQEQLGRPCRFSDSFAALGADELDLVEIVMVLEERLSVDLPDDALESVKTVGDMVKYVIRCGASGLPVQDDLPVHDVPDGERQALQFKLRELGRQLDSRVAAQRLTTTGPIWGGLKLGCLMSVIGMGVAVLLVALVYGTGQARPSPVPGLVWIGLTMGGVVAGGVRGRRGAENRRSAATQEANRQIETLSEEICRDYPDVLQIVGSADRLRDRASLRNLEAVLARETSAGVAAGPNTGKASAAHSTCQKCHARDSAEWACPSCRLAVCASCAGAPMGDQAHARKLKDYYEGLSGMEVNVFDLTGGGDKPTCPNCGRPMTHIEAAAEARGEVDAATLDRYVDQIAAKVKCTTPGEAAGLYDQEAAVRAIGVRINERFGFTGMQYVWRGVGALKGPGATSELTRIWNGVGRWQS